MGHLAQDYIGKCSQTIVANQFKEESSEFTLLDKLKSFQQESLEWEKASQFLCECLATKSDLELVPPLKKNADEENVEKPASENKTEADFALNEVPLEKDDHVRGEEIFVLGSNEIITSRPISRPSEGSLAEPLTENSTDEFKTLNTVSQLQMELLNTEERAQTAELRIEELEERVRELERKLTRGEVLDEKPAQQEAERVPSQTVKKEETSVVPNQSQLTVESMQSESSALTARSRPSTTNSSISKGKGKKQKKKGR